VSPREKVFALAAAGVLTLGILGMCWQPLGPYVDGLRYLEVATIFATGLVVLLYTIETRDLRVAADRQVNEAGSHALTQARANVRPILLADVAGGNLRLTNVGLGAALDVQVMVGPLHGDLLGQPRSPWRFDFSRLPAVLPGDKQERTPPYSVEFGMQEGDGDFLEPSGVMMKAVNNLGPGDELSVFVEFTDGYGRRSRTEFRFTTGEHYARMVGVTELP